MSVAGLVAANGLARTGKSVVVLEKSNRFGGRAMTVNKNGASFNLGVHALYGGGAAEEIFRDLGLVIEGGTPHANGSVLWNNKVSPLSKFILSRDLSWAGKMELVRLLVKIRKIDTSAMPGYPWLPIWIFVLNGSRGQTAMLVLGLTNRCFTPINRRLQNYRRMVPEEPIRKQTSVFWSRQ